MNIYSKYWRCYKGENFTVFLMRILHFENNIVFISRFLDPWNTTKWFIILNKNYFLHSEVLRSWYYIFHKRFYHLWQWWWKNRFFLYRLIQKIHFLLLNLILFENKAQSETIKAPLELIEWQCSKLKGFLFYSIFLFFFKCFFFIIGLSTYTIYTIADKS